MSRLVPPVLLLAAVAVVASCSINSSGEVRGWEEIEPGQSHWVRLAPPGGLGAAGAEAIGTIEIQLDGCIVSRWDVSTADQVVYAVVPSRGSSLMRRKDDGTLGLRIPGADVIEDGMDLSRLDGVSASYKVPVEADEVEYVETCTEGKASEIMYLGGE